MTSTEVVALLGAFGIIIAAVYLFWSETRR